MLAFRLIRLSQLFAPRVTGQRNDYYATGFGDTPGMQIPKDSKMRMSRALFVCWIACTAPASLSAEEYLPEPEELKFSKPVFHTSVEGVQRIATLGLRKIPNGQTGIWLTCVQGQNLGIAIKLHPQGTLDFGWMRSVGNQGVGYSINFDIEYKMAGQPVLPEQRYKAAVRLPRLSAADWKSAGVPAPLMVKNFFFWSDWDHLRVATTLKGGQRVSVKLLKRDPALTEFFTACDIPGAR